MSRGYTSVTVCVCVLWVYGGVGSVTYVIVPCSMRSVRHHMAMHGEFICVAFLTVVMLVTLCCMCCVARFVLFVCVVLGVVVGACGGTWFL